MVEQLFGSKTRVKLLRLFFSNPNRSYYVREITRKIDEQINSVRRELSNLLSIGIITSDTTNNRLYYEVNQKYEFYEPLKAMFGIGSDKAAGKTKAKAEVDSGTDELKTLGNVSLVVYTGQFTRDEAAGVDVLVVGDVNQTKVDKFIAGLEAEEGKELRYVVMPLDEFKYRQQIHDRFISGLKAGKKQILVDKFSLLEN